MDVCANHTADAVATGEVNCLFTLAVRGRGQLVLHGRQPLIPGTRQSEQHRLGWPQVLTTEPRNEDRNEEQRRQFATRPTTPQAPSARTPSSADDFRCIDCRARSTTSRLARPSVQLPGRLGGSGVVPSILCNLSGH